MKNSNRLENLNIMLSASLPDELNNTFKAQDFYSFLLTLVRGILTNKGNIVFGGHPTVTPMVYNIAKQLKKEPSKIILFQHAFFKESFKKQEYDENVFDKIIWVGNKKNTPKSTDFNNDLYEMRIEMSIVSDISIFFGGKTENNLTKSKGIREEFKLFTNKKIKFYYRYYYYYLLGLFGGETSNIIKELNERKIKQKNMLNEKELKDVENSTDYYWVANLVLSDLIKISKKLNLSLEDYSNKINYLDRIFKRLN
jgi:hypothetical protein